MRNSVLSAALLALFSALPAHAGSDWTTFGGNMQREGFNAHESVLTPGTVPGLQQHWATSLNGPILAQPTVARGIQTAGGKRQLVFAANMYGAVYALNAGNGGVVWKTKLGKTRTGCEDLRASATNFGVLGTPVLDLPNNRMLVVDGTGMLHALGLGDGTEQSGFPIQIIDGANQGVAFDWGSPALSGSTLYVPTSSTCDTGPMQGEVIAVDLNGPQVMTRWFVTGNGGPSGGGIWGFGGVSLEADGSAVYAATGNAFSEPQNAGFAEHVVKLDPSLNVQAADGPNPVGSDDDFGATPLLFDPPGCPPMAAAMQKSGNLFIYNRNQIGSGPVQDLQIAQGSDNGDFIGNPTYDPGTNALYLGSPNDNPPYHHGLIALAVGSNCRLSLLWQRQAGLNDVGFNNPMIPPTVAHGVVWFATGDGSRFAAFSAKDGTRLWNSGTTIGGGVFTSPTVANGQVFVGAFDHFLYAFGL